MHSLLTPPTFTPVFQLSCGHAHCKTCLTQIQEKGGNETCPICRESPPPPGPDTLFELGQCGYLKIEAMVERAEVAWASLSVEQRKREMDAARAMLAEASDQGHLDAQVLCGDIYSSGWGVPKDDRLAFLYHERAAEQGDVEAMFNTGFSFENGLGCEQNDERAAEWYEKSAQRGDPDAQLSLGNLYWSGRGVPQSHERAAELFGSSAANGNADGQNNLAACYALGNGVTQSWDHAVENFKQSADQGHPTAQFNLAVMFENSVGVAQDYKEARRLFVLAAKQGHLKVAPFGTHTFVYTCARACTHTHAYAVTDS